MLEGNRVGIEAFDFPDSTPEGEGIRIFKGNVPKERPLTNQISALGPFDVVYGVDVFKSHLGFGYQFEPGISNVENLRWVNSRLNEGGVFIILNDGETPTVFTEEEARSAGFNLVRWRAQRQLPQKIREMFGSIFPKAGSMYLYVLRKGEFDRSRLRGL